MAYLSRAWSTPLSRFTNRHFASLVYSEEVCQAKTDKKPIVALESTIITHGMPYPKNLETAFQVEEVIREKVSLNYLIIMYINSESIHFENFTQNA